MKSEFFDVDNEVTVLSEAPASRRKGSRQLDAISVEYKQEKETGSYISKRKVFKGESSNSESGTGESNKGVKRIPPNPICEICTEDKRRYDMLRIVGCAHYYCCSCIEKYVISKLENNVTIINCPFMGCNGILEPNHFLEILPKKVLDRWGDALCEAVILGSEKLYCPFKNCSAVLIDDNFGGNGKAIMESECPYCNRLFCARCKAPWHVGITCADFQKLNKDERSNEDRMLMELAKREKWQRCPRCRAMVEKIDGCLIMDCRCKYSFCYKCAAPLAGHHPCEDCGDEDEDEDEVEVEVEVEDEDEVEDENEDEDGYGDEDEYEDGEEDEEY